MFFVNVMEGGDISIGRRCCEEGHLYVVPKHTAGFAFRAGLGDAQTVNYDHKHNTKNDVVVVVMSEFGNGAKKGPTHCAPVHPNGNVPSVDIFDEEKRCTKRTGCNYSSKRSTGCS